MLRYFPTADLPKTKTAQNYQPLLLLQFPPITSIRFQWIPIFPQYHVTLFFARTMKYFPTAARESEPPKDLYRLDCKISPFQFPIFASFISNVNRLNFKLSLSHSQTFLVSITKPYHPNFECPPHEFHLQSPSTRSENLRRPLARVHERASVTRGPRRACTKRHRNDTSTAYSVR